MNTTDWGRYSVLLVDENRYMRILLRGLLGAMGIKEVREAADGADGFREMRSFPPDLIITELQMAPLDGLDFVRLVRNASDSPNPYVPILMVTSYTERRYVEEARDVGVSEFLAKPVSAEALYARVLAALQRPRPFVRAKSYFGPDRRRRQVERPGLPERRSNRQTGHAAAAECRG